MNSTSSKLGVIAAQTEKRANLRRIIRKYGLAKTAGNPFQAAGNFLGGAANKALQSPIGQGALNFGANAYNKMPQGARDWASNKAYQMGGLNNQNTGSWKMPGFKADPSQGVGIDSSTTVKNDELVEDRITSTTPGHAGSPWSQLARGAMTGRMPTSTFPQGSPVSNRLDINMDQITGDTINRRAPVQAPMTQQPQPAAPPMPQQPQPQQPPTGSDFLPQGGGGSR